MQDLDGGLPPKQKRRLYFNAPFPPALLAHAPLPLTGRSVALLEADERLRRRMHRRIPGSFFPPPSSVSPDRFGATFVDLHIHRTARVYVGGQIDLRELRLGKTRRRGKRHVRQKACWDSTKSVHRRTKGLTGIQGKKRKEKRIFDCFDVGDFFLNFIFILVVRQSDRAKRHKGSKLGYSQSSGQ